MASLLHGGAVMGIRFQPHESHLPFLLQFKVGQGTCDLKHTAPTLPVQLALRLWLSCP